MSIVFTPAFFMDWYLVYPFFHAQNIWFSYTIDRALRGFHINLFHARFSFFTNWYLVYLFFTVRMPRSVSTYAGILCYVHVYFFPRLFTFFTNRYPVFLFHGQNISFYYTIGKKCRVSHVYFWQGSVLCLHSSWWECFVMVQLLFASCVLFKCIRTVVTFFIFYSSCILFHVLEPGHDYHGEKVQILFRKRMHPPSSITEIIREALYFIKHTER